MIFHGDRVRNRRVREDGTFPVRLRIPRTEAPVKSEQLTYMVAKSNKKQGVWKSTASYTVLMTKFCETSMVNYSGARFHIVTEIRTIYFYYLGIHSNFLILRFLLDLNEEIDAPEWSDVGQAEN